MDNTGPDWQPVHKLRAYEHVIQQIEAHIYSGALVPGDRLPGERQLSAELNVSRTSVREAWRVLEALGVVSVRPGTGPDSGATLVGQPNTAISTLLRLHIGLSQLRMDDVVEARITLESWACERAAQIADPEAIAEMQVYLDQMTDDDAVTPDQYYRIDTEFHAAIARAAGNPLIELFMEGIRGGTQRILAARLAQADDPPKVMKRLTKEHTALLKAIREGDSQAAVRLLESHVRGFYETSVVTPAG